MADLVKFELKGFRELGEKLKDFGPQVAKNGLRSADLAGTKIVLKAAQSTQEWKDVSGLLRAAITISRRRTPEYIAKYSVVVKSKLKVTKIRRFSKGRNKGKYTSAAPPSIYGRFLEYGTSKMSARPWLRPSLNNNVPAAIEAIRAGLQKAIDRAAKRAGLKVKT